MCTSIISNERKTIVGWNLDITGMEHKVVVEKDKVYIAINDKTEGWLPLFGANSRGDFVAMPTCWPFDERSNPIGTACRNIIMLNIDLLLCKKTLGEIKEIVENESIYSVPGITFQAQLSDKEGNALQIVPGQGCRYLKKPRYSVMTNFSPFKGNQEQHPWMGWDRYNTAVKMLDAADETFDVADCFKILEATAQSVCPTVVSMVFDVSEGIIYWCANRVFSKIEKKNIYL